MITKAKSEFIFILTHRYTKYVQRIFGLITYKFDILVKLDLNNLMALNYLRDGYG